MYLKFIHINILYYTSMKIIVQAYIFYLYIFIIKKYLKNVKLSLYQQKYFIERYLYIYLKK